ncbi:MAG: SusC/RagA family TonB-linked outer membrane protein [Bacteroidales bacterium]|nr:MAG: SusC/RagA family TonB-linked outer membrane protein [Bacteroidales bacterium]
MRRILYLLIISLFVSFHANGQGKMIQGKVVDEQGLPLPGVSVIIVGTNQGVSTDIDGKFSIEAAKGSLLRLSFIGYNTQEVTIGDLLEVNIAMVAASQQIDEVVVTALGIKREKKSLGYAVQDVKSEDLTTAGDANISTALQGKVAGVIISESGSGAGGSSRIEIRGASSLTDNNKPMIVVDGVPFNSSSTFIDRNTNQSDNQAGVWGGTEIAGGIADINPEDIESVSVLKGANAAALYGSRAGNGVILITTKKGTRKGLNINYSTNFTVSKLAYFHELQNKYGQGSNGVYDRFGTSSWGPLMEGQMLQSWTGELIPYSAQTDRIKDFTRDGTSQNHNLSVSAGNENGSIRVSASKGNETGILKGNKINKSNFDLSTIYNISKWLNIDAKASYFLTKGSNRPEMGYYGIITYFDAMPMNIRNRDLKAGVVIGSDGRHIEKLYTTTNANYRNPYFLQEQTYNNDERNRGFGYFATTFTIIPELKLKLKYGLDFYREGTTNGYYFADNVNSQRPDYNTGQKFFKEENSEFLLSYNKDFKDFSLSVNAGGNRMYSYSQKLTSKSGLLPSEGNYFLGYGTNITSSEDFREQEVQSIYGFAQFGYKKLVFLDITARNDWPSTLPVDNNSYFYPSVSLSGIVSEMVKLPDWFSYAKVRSSWAQVGKGTEPYWIDENYFITTWNFNLLNGNVPGVLVNKNLKPEISSSVEFGADLRFLNNRIGLDFTYYDEETKNQILPLEMDQSTGYSKKLINAGLITNKGVEILLNTTPVKSKDFQLEVGFNFAKNTTILKKLDPDVKVYPFGSGIIGIEGEKMGDISGSVYSKDVNGKIIAGADGLPMIQDSLVTIGNMQPDWTGSVSLKANYKGLYLSALISIQQGGDILSISEQAATANGNAQRTVTNDRMSFFFDGPTESGGVNNTLISAQQYWGRVSSVSEEFIYDASNMKMRELAIGYELPKNLLDKIPFAAVKSARIALVGRNLFYFYKHTPGTAPDASSYSNGYAAQALDFGGIPAARTYGFSINIGF